MQTKVKFKKDSISFSEFSSVNSKLNHNHLSDLPSDIGLNPNFFSLFWKQSTTQFQESTQFLSIILKDTHELIYKGKIRLKTLS